MEQSMSYYIGALPNKKSEPKWKVQYVSFNKLDYKDSKAKFPKKELIYMVEEKDLLISCFQKAMHLKISVCGWGTRL